MCVRAGYSDSGKDAGRMAAAWALFETQEKLVAVANEYGVKLVLFHGRCVKLKAVNFLTAIDLFYSKQLLCICTYTSMQSKGY